MAFTSKYFYYTFLLLFFIFIISEIYITIKASRNSIGKNKGDKGSLYIIIIGVYLIIVINFFWSFSNISLPSYFEIIGLLMIILGVFIRVYSVVILGKAFTLNVSIGNKQKIIKSGIYRFIRHPSYLGSIITILGISIFIRNLVNILITLFILILIYGYRIKIEEKALIKVFGDDYVQYKKETKYIFPKIL